MPKRLLALNALLVGASVGLIAYIGWQIAPAKTDTPTRRAASGSAATPTAASPSTADRSGGAYGAIASRNLFSPDRSEAPSGAMAANALAALPKPSLHGVILRDGAPMAYLEDPVTKRVAGYRVGDSIAGGTLQSISEDRVILVRPEGQVDVRLHDPSRPRPPVPATAAGQPEGVPGAQRPPFPIPQPGVPQPFPGATPPGFQPPVTSTQPDLQGQQPGRRPLPPNLLRRVPPGIPDAPNR